MASRPAPTVSEGRDGRFSARTAGKQFSRGVVDGLKEPLRIFKEWPKLTALVAGSAIAAAVFVPPIGLAISAIGAGLALWRSGRGAYEAIKHLRRGEPDDAEEAFREIGHGVGSGVLIGASYGVGPALNLAGVNPAQAGPLGNAATGATTAVRRSVAVAGAKFALNALVPQPVVEHLRERVADRLHRVGDWIHHAESPDDGPLP